MKCTVPQQDRITGNRIKNSCSNFEFTPHGISAVLPLRSKYPIYFCKTDYIRSFFDFCRSNPDEELVLITHNSDINISPELYSATPSNVKAWFGQNIDTVGANLHSLPIGSTGATWIGELEWADQQDEHDFVLMKEDGHPKVYKNLLYMNFGIWTNRTHREPIYDFLKDKSWVTTTACDIAPSAYSSSEGFVSLKEYYNSLYNHKFTISPLGNGVDCGRVWQAIYMGCIPIVPSHLNINHYRDLPILVYNNLDELTEEYLEEQHELLKNSKCLDKATLSHWVKTINKAAGRD
jgi:hypothetical protein